MLCIRKFPVAKKYIDKREGEVSRFPLNFFCFKVSKNAKREPFSVSLISGIEKKMDERCGGEAGVSRLSVEIFLSPSAKNFVG